MRSLRLILAALLASSLWGLPARAQCVNLFYDAAGGATARTYAMALENLLGHFPSFRVQTATIETYRRGMLDACDASFYIGSFYDNKIPDDFLQDYATATKPVAWVGYNIWRLGSRLPGALGATYLGLTPLDNAHKDAQGRPTFFRDFQYKGEVFSKYGEFGSNGKFAADFEMSQLRITDPSTQVLSTAVHNSSGATLPYIVRRQNRFFVADIPFTYIHEADRYLIFSDLLFDVLGQAPKYGTVRPAVLRIEDVHVCLPTRPLTALADLSERLHVPLHIAFIPIFKDPFDKTSMCGTQTEVSVDHATDFRPTLDRLKAVGARFIWHGVTHQLDQTPNPSGVSGDDYEFWQIKSDTPAPLDSADWVLSRLERGWSSLAAAGIHPKIWEVPHYMASALDYLIFGRVFGWNIGRIQYIPVQASGLPAASPALTYAQSGSAGAAARKSAFARTQLQADPSDRMFQYFPYEIARDVYGQKVFPENLGYATVAGPAGIAPLLSTAKRNRVLRDSWASFFYHPFLLGADGNTAALEQLITGLRQLGYEFVDLEAQP
jgi:uncharacterized protein YdaL